MNAGYRVSFPGLNLKFDLNPVAFNIGVFSIRWYGVFLALGFLLALIYALHSCRRFNLDQNKMTNAIIVGFITGIIGARLYYIIFYPGNYYIDNPLSVLYINEGGIAIYGGIIGGIAGGIIVAKLQKINIPAMLDLACLGFLIGQSIGRWGNLTNQEAFGSQTDLPWRMVSENTLGLGVHPCFLYESLWCALIFLMLHIFSLKFRKYNGQIALLYMVWYGIGRFFIESLRTDSLYIMSSDIKVSQAISALIFISGIVLLIIFRNKCDLERLVNNI